MGTGFPEHHRLIPALAGWTRRLVSSDIQKLAPWRHRKLTPKKRRMSCMRASKSGSTVTGDAAVAGFVDGDGEADRGRRVEHVGYAAVRGDSKRRRRSDDEEGVTGVRRRWGRYGLDTGAGGGGIGERRYSQTIQSSDSDAGQGVPLRGAAGAGGSATGGRRAPGVLMDGRWSERGHASGLAQTEDCQPYCQPFLVLPAVF